MIRRALSPAGSVRIGKAEIPSNRYHIGQPVLYLVDKPNDPAGDYYDHLDPTDRFYWWYRGIVVGVEYSPNHDYHPGAVWFYKVKILQGYDGTPDPMNGAQFIELYEHEFKPSPYLDRNLSNFWKPNE